MRHSRRFGALRAPIFPIGPTPTTTRFVTGVRGVFIYHLFQMARRTIPTRGINQLKIFGSRSSGFQSPQAASVITPKNITMAEAMTLNNTVNIIPAFLSCCCTPSGPQRKLRRAQRSRVDTVQSPFSPPILNQNNTHK